MDISILIVDDDKLVVEKLVEGASCRSRKNEPAEAAGTDKVIAVPGRI